MSASAFYGVLIFGFTMTSAGTNPASAMFAHLVFLTDILFPISPGVYLKRPIFTLATIPNRESTSCALYSISHGFHVVLISGTPAPLLYLITKPMFDPSPRHCGLCAHHQPSFLEDFRFFRRHTLRSRSSKPTSPDPSITSRVPPSALITEETPHGINRR